MAGEPLPVRGSCLKLWRRSAIKDALYHTLTSPSVPRQYGYPMPAPKPVFAGTMSDADLDALQSAGAARQRSGGSPAARTDAVLEAWVAMMRPYFAGPDSCFFTGTYRDAYGYPNGITKPENVLRDFKRFLSAQGHTAAWVVCAEPHQEREIWHCHALLANCSESARAILKAEWGATRGYADAPALLDGGVNYCTKYALKGSNSIMFDWNLS